MHETRRMDLLRKIKRLKLYSARFTLVAGLLLLVVSKFPVRGASLWEWWREWHSGAILSGAATQVKVVALTFDDGPDPRYTPSILQILDRYKAPATFFEVGQQIAAYPALAQQIRDRGDVIGNHSYSHPYLDHESAAAVRLEIAGCDDSLRDYLHLKTHLFRPPRGRITPAIFRAAQRSGERIVLWTVALEHHDAPTPQAMADRVLRQVRPGGIILMHDGGSSRENTVRALPILLDALKSRGYRFVTVPQLLHIRGNDAL